MVAFEEDKKEEGVPVISMRANVEIFETHSGISRYQIWVVPLNLARVFIDPGQLGGSRNLPVGAPSERPTKFAILYDASMMSFLDVGVNVVNVNFEPLFIKIDPRSCRISGAPLQSVLYEITKQRRQ